MLNPGWIARISRITLRTFVLAVLLTGCAVAESPASTVTTLPTTDPTAPVAVATATVTPAPPLRAASPTPIPATPTARPTPTPVPVTPDVDFGKVHPNELGEIPILEYHLITNEDGRWSRSWQHFQSDLARLYSLGYRTVPLQDVVDDRINVPAGYSPVVLTFDDSSPGQFTFIEQGGKLIPDPHSAVGVLDAFDRDHPDFGEHATFFVLPAADPPHNLFGQDQYQKLKLDYLVEHGMEIGNHTYWHQNLAGVGDSEVQRQIGQAVQVIDGLVPGYDLDLFALPDGAWPKHRELAIQGVWNGIRYNNRAVLLVGARPVLSPDRVGFDPLAMPRIQAIPQQLDRWLSALDHGVHQRYVSDGDPNRVAFPTTLSDQFQSKPGDEKLKSPDANYEVYRLR